MAFHLKLMERQVLEEFRSITEINPRLMAGLIQGPTRKPIVTAAFVWTTGETIAVAPVTSPLSGDSLRHILTAPFFAMTIRAQLSPAFASAKMLHVPYRSTEPFPLNQYAWMDDSGVFRSKVSATDINEIVPAEFQLNAPPDDLTRQYLRRLNLAARDLYRSMFSNQEA